MKGKKKAMLSFDVSATRHCKSCNVNVHIGTGGEGNWTQHLNSKSHLDKEQTKSSNKSIKNFFRKLSQSPTRKDASSSHQAKPPTAGPSRTLSGDTPSITKAVMLAKPRVSKKQHRQKNGLRISEMHSTRMLLKDYGDNKIDDENPSFGESKSEVEASEIGEEDKGREEGAQRESLAETADNATGAFATSRSGRKRRVRTFEDDCDMICADEACGQLVTLLEALSCNSPGCNLVFHLTC